MATFSPSELILNADGSIYHLQLLPHHMADTILTVGDPNRVSLVSAHFDKVEYQIQKREFLTHTGWIGERRLTVISTGIGPDNIDIVINELDALANIDLESRTEKKEKKSLKIIRVGTSGALQPDLNPGQLVVSAFGLGLDNLLSYYSFSPNLGEAELTSALLTFQEETERWPAQPYSVSADYHLLNTMGKEMTAGITLTSPGFYGPQGRNLRLKSRMASLQTLPVFQYKGYRITNFEMETAALYGLCRLLGHQAVSCNVILANRFQGTFSKNPKSDINYLIQKVLQGLD